MITFLVVGFSIRNSTEAAAAQVRQSLGSSFTVKQNFDPTNTAVWQKVTDEKGDTGLSYTGPNLSDEVVAKIMQTNGIKEYTAEDRIEFLDTGLTLKPGLESNFDKFNNPNIAVLEAQSRVQVRVAEFYVVTDSSLHQFFRNGAFSLAKGRHIQPGDKGKALISEDLAQRNGLTVGDTFSARMDEILFDYKADSKTIGDPIPFEIVGIYQINFKNQPSDVTPEDQIAENFIFTDPEAGKLYNRYYMAYRGIDTNLSNTYASATFFVDDPKNLDSVIKQVNGIRDINWQYFEITRDDAAYQAQIRPLETIGGLTTFLIAAAAAGCFILLTLVLGMWIKSRRKEIGVLRSIGIRKHKIIFQFIFECLLVGALAFGASWFAAGAAANLAGYIAAGMAAGDGAGEKYVLSYTQLGGSSIEQIADNAKLSCSVDAENYLIVLGLSTAVIVASVGLSSAKILRQNPREILCG